MHLLSSTLRAWEGASLTGSLLPQLVALPDAAKAVALGTLLRSTSLTSLTLHGCRLGMRSAECISELLVERCVLG